MYPNGYYTPFNGMPFSQNIGLGRSVGLGTGRIAGLGKLAGASKGLNWSGLFTNASKALNVANQAIPLVRQVGPMFNNMKSMVRLAGAFKDETETTKPKVTNNNSFNINNNLEQPNNINNSYNNNTPNFFLN